MKNISLNNLFFIFLPILFSGSYMKKNIDINRVMISKEDKVREIIRRLVRSSYYLPYASAEDLSKLPLKIIYDDVEKIKRRALEILYDEHEIYRVLIHMLSRYTVVTKRSFEIALQKTDLKISRRDVDKIFMELVMLNYAYISPQQFWQRFLEFCGLKIREPMVLVSTIQSRALIEDVDKDLAEKIIDFGIGLRRKVIEAILDLRPIRVDHVFRYVYDWAERKAKEIKYEHLERMFSRNVYEDLLIAPYYLHQYNFINIDLIRYELFLELKTSF